MAEIEQDELFFLAQMPVKASEKVLFLCVLNDLRKMFSTNYHYLLVIVSGEGGVGSFLALHSAAVFRPMPLLQRSIDNNKKRLLKKWQCYTRMILANRWKYNTGNYN